MLCRLRHPNIVALLAIATRGNNLYVDTELIDGADLGSLLFGDEPKFALAEKNRHSIAMQLLQAVAYMHGQGVVHQDIKPANVLITANSMVTKLSDLGFGKLAGSNGTLASKATGLVFDNPGTRLYMAPECLLGFRRATASSDMWSVGGTLAELYTSLSYWDFSDDDFELAAAESVDDALFAKVKREERPGILHNNSFIANVPLAMRSVLEACLQYDASSRPTALEVIPTASALVQV